MVLGLQVKWSGFLCSVACGIVFSWYICMAAVISNETNMGKNICFTIFRAFVFITRRRHKIHSEDPPAAPSALRLRLPSNVIFG